MTLTFDANQPLGAALQDWWEDLQQRPGDRAELCRAQTLTDVLLLPAFQRACLRFRPFFQYEQHWEPRLALVLGLVAHVRRTSDQKLAREMASPTSQEPPVLSELRFRRLLQRERPDLLLAMIRVLRMLGHRANLHDLANSVYFWGDAVKRRWAFDYFPNVPEKSST
jgi:CRISPR system Cascade subunit CasB